jgi:hypothetical protein
MVEGIGIEDIASKLAKESALPLSRYRVAAYMIAPSFTSAPGTVVIESV